jgi:cephalosporin-C deacetylase-like acetyl esterase
MGPQKFPADFDRDVLFVCVHPHGFLPGRDDAFYSAAFAAISNGGHGGAYGFRDAENADPRSCYFRGMVQRALAAVRFAKTLPAWDGEHVTFAGRGQGAFLAVACAALDGDATFLRLSAPWLCGLGLDTSWQPSFQPSLRYFDAVNFAKRVDVPAQIEADLLDTAHSPAGAARLYNALRGPKKLVFRQGEGTEPVATLEAGTVAAALPAATLPAGTAGATGEGPAR